MSKCKSEKSFLLPFWAPQWYLGRKVPKYCVEAILTQGLKIYYHVRKLCRRAAWRYNARREDRSVHLAKQGADN